MRAHEDGGASRGRALFHGKPARARHLPAVLRRPPRERPMSGRELLSLTLDRLDDLPDPVPRPACSGSWTRSSPSARTSAATPSSDKESWVSAALLEWGSVGRVAYVDGAPVGYVTYAPAYLVPRAAGFPTAPVSGDAVLLMTAAVAPEHSGSGLGRMLVQAAAKDLHRRNVRAMEAFGRSVPVPRQLGGCVLPASFLSEVGFKTVREHAVWPRMRLDLRTVLSWREDMEAAVERLLQQVRQPVLDARTTALSPGRTTPRRRPAPPRARRRCTARPEARRRRLRHGRVPAGARRRSAGPGLQVGPQVAQVQACPWRWCRPRRGRCRCRATTTASASVSRNCGWASSAASSGWVR